MTTSKPFSLETTIVFVQQFNRPEELCYRVARRVGTNAVVYDEPDYTAAFTAYLEASRVADELNAIFDVPVDMKGRLASYWSRRGQWLFRTDHPRSLCENQYERQAYDQAEAQMMAYIDEKDCKPGLVDYVPMDVHVGEYGRGEAVAR